MKKIILLIVLMFVVGCKNTVSPVVSTKEYHSGRVDLTESQMHSLEIIFKIVISDWGIDRNTLINIYLHNEYKDTWTTPRKHSIGKDTLFVGVLNNEFQGYDLRDATGKTKQYIDWEIITYKKE